MRRLPSNSSCIGSVVNCWQHRGAFSADEADCADAIQETFFSAFRAINQFERKFNPWDLAASDHGQRLPDEAAISHPPVRGFDRGDFCRRLTNLAIMQRACVGGSGRPMNNFCGTRLDRWSAAASTMLSDDYRTVLLLRDIEQISTEETAAIFGANPGTIKIRLHRRAGTADAPRATFLA